MRIRRESGTALCEKGEVYAHASATAAAAERRDEIAPNDDESSTLPYRAERAGDAPARKSIRVRSIGGARSGCVGRGGGGGGGRGRRAHHARAPCLSRAPAAARRCERPPPAARRPPAALAAAAAAMPRARRRQPAEARDLLAAAAA
ncbi:unnamed protein product, partial [Iphiclides podalirius]